MRSNEELQRLSSMRWNMTCAKALLRRALDKVMRIEARKEMHDILLGDQADKATLRACLMKLLWETIVQVSEDPKDLNFVFFALFKDDGTKMSKAISNLPSDIHPIFYGKYFIRALCGKGEIEDRHKRKAIALCEALGLRCYIDFISKRDKIPFSIPLELLDKLNIKAASGEQATSELTLLFRDTNRLKDILNDKDITKARDLFAVMLEVLGEVEFTNRVQEIVSSKEIDAHLAELVFVLIYHNGAPLENIELQEKHAKSAIAQPQRDTIKLLINLADSTEDLDIALNTAVDVVLDSEEIKKEIDNKRLKVIEAEKIPSDTSTHSSLPSIDSLPHQEPQPHANKSIFDNCITQAVLYGVGGFVVCKLLEYTFASSSIAQCIGEHKMITSFACAGFGMFYKIAEGIKPSYSELM